MTRGVWDNLLAEVRDLHNTCAILQEFCKFPNDLSAQEVVPFQIAPSELFQNDNTLGGEMYGACIEALRTCARLASWRETYKDTTIGADFMDRFGCYGLIGSDAPFTSDKMRAWMVYMPANLWYPWHQHPAEEIYLTLAGQAVFKAAGEDDVALQAGEAKRHYANQPHATQTKDRSYLAYVVWRDEFETLP